MYVSKDDVLCMLVRRYFMFVSKECFCMQVSCLLCVNKGFMYVVKMVFCVCVHT